MAVNIKNYDRNVDKKISRLSRIIIVSLFAVTAVIICMFCFGPYDAEFEGPEHTDAMLNWAYILLGVSIVAALTFPVVEFIRKPKQGLKGMLPLLGLAIVAFVCYQLGDGTVLDMPGYNGPDNVPGTLKITDAILLMTYILMVVDVLAIFATEIFKKIKK